MSRFGWSTHTGTVTPANHRANTGVARVRWTGFSRSTIRYRSRRPPQEELRDRIPDLALERPWWGYRRIHVLLRREGWPVNRKRVQRLYREEGLTYGILRLPLMEGSESGRVSDRACTGPVEKARK